VSATNLQFEQQDDTQQEPQNANSHGNNFCSGAYSNNAKRQRNSSVGQVKSGTRSIGAVSRTSSNYSNITPGTVSQLEFDTHADTCCFGANFTFYFTEHTCEVTPFLESYSPMQNIPVVSAATAYDDPDTGETVILEFHQGLWFGNAMPHSLINPNQCQHYGIVICDNPYDPDRTLSLRDPVSETDIPLVYQGNIVSLMTRAPTIEEISDRSLRHVTMSSQELWDPSSISTRPLLKEEEERLRFRVTIGRAAITGRSEYACDETSLLVAGRRTMEESEIDTRPLVRQIIV
jgi:hypothetical protein